ncbi:MAG: chorismate synthase [Bacteroidales bacterium]|nr:chorismate synthase [Bacteroidales bacterium]
MNTFGKNFRVSIFGESHSPIVGVTLDGVPAGMELTPSDFVADIDRRRSGAKGTTPRTERDVPQFLSGIYDNHTTGAPLTIIFPNENVRSGDYSEFVSTPRPGHADFTASERFGGWNDPRGGGHFSGRLTLAVVAAGVVAKKIMASRMTATIGVENPQIMNAEIVELGGLTDKAMWDKALDDAHKEGDSLGAIVQCRAELPAGVGEPFWDSVESLVSHAVFAIPGVRGIEFGDGFRASAMKGSQHNDTFGIDGMPSKNGSGGVNGGISNGAPLEFRVAFKPTSSISKPQKTLNFESGEMVDLICKGRHDVCFALRAPVVVEAMTAIVLADLLY